MQFQGLGAHPWILQRRNGLARGIYYRLVTDARFSGGQISAEVQWRLNTVICGSGYSAYLMVFGSNPVGLFGWGDTDEDLLPPRIHLFRVGFAQQWQLPMMGQEAALKQVADSKLRRLLVYGCEDWGYCFTRQRIGRARHVGEGRRRFWTLMTLVRRLQSQTSEAAGGDFGH